MMAFSKSAAKNLPGLMISKRGSSERICDLSNKGSHLPSMPSVAKCHIIHRRGRAEIVRLFAFLARHLVEPEGDKSLWFVVSLFIIMCLRSGNRDPCTLRNHSAVRERDIAQGLAVAQHLNQQRFTPSKQSAHQGPDIRVCRSHPSMPFTRCVSFRKLSNLSILSTEALLHPSVLTIASASSRSGWIY